MKYKRSAQSLRSALDGRLENICICRTALEVGARAPSQSGFETVPGLSDGEDVLRLGGIHLELPAQL
jgi:hypothetical protein